MELARGGEQARGGGKRAQQAEQGDVGKGCDTPRDEREGQCHRGDSKVHPQPDVQAALVDDQRAQQGTDDQDEGASASVQQSPQRERHEQRVDPGQVAYGEVLHQPGIQRQQHEGQCAEDEGKAPQRAQLPQAERREQQVRGQQGENESLAAEPVGKKEPGTVGDDFRVGEVQPRGIDRRVVEIDGYREEGRRHHALLAQRGHQVGDEELVLAPVEQAHHAIGPHVAEPQSAERRRDGEKGQQAPELSVKKGGARPCGNGHTSSSNDRRRPVRRAACDPPPRHVQASSAPL